MKLIKKRWYQQEMIKKKKEERLNEVLRLRRNLQNLGYNNTHEEIKRLFQVLSEYVNDGEYRKEKFFVTGYDKVIYVVLLPRQYAENIVRIRDEKL